MPAKIENPVSHFWSKVRKGTGNACWNWQMGTNGRYGTFYPLENQLKEVVAHRIAYILSFGSVPDDLEVCHRCDNPTCCNPNHLFLATHKANMSDMMTKGRWRGAIGEKQGSAKLTEKAVKQIRKLAKSGHGVSVLAKRFGVTKRAIHWVVRRVNWKHVE